MDGVIILVVAFVLLLVIFLVIILVVGKQTLNGTIIPLDKSKSDINNYLKEKYRVYKDIVNYIKDNLSIKEEAFQDFLDFNAKECLQSDLIDLLDKTTYEINEYVDNYDELLKDKEFLELKRKLYNIQVNLEATIDYYNNKLTLYNSLKDKSPTNLATKFFSFDEYNQIKNDKEEISRLINLN